MATFFVNESNVTVTGSVNDDQFFIESGVQNIDLQGLAGADEFQYFFGTVNSSYNFGNSNVNANGGDDTIRVKLNSGSDIFASQFRGGLNNDSIVVTAVSAETSNLPTFAGNLLQGGQGNDTIKLKIESSQYNNLTLNGNEGADFIRLSATANVSNRVSNVNLFGGQGSDQINIDVGGSGNSDFSIAGGLGSDRLQLQFGDNSTAASAIITNLVVNGGTFGTDSVDDEGDDIFISAEEILGKNSVLGNGGNDTMRLVAETATNLLFAGNAGDDTLIFSANAAVNVTIAGGNGDDEIEVAQSAGVFNSANGGRNSLIGGLGDDTFFIHTGVTSNMSGATVTIQGGKGADLFFLGNSADQDRSAMAAISAANFAYTTLTDSTIDVLDTIVVGTGGSAGSGIALTMFMPNAVPVTVFNDQAGGFQFSAGILDMSTAAGSGGNISLSQIVGTLDATLAEGDAVAFRLTTASTAGFLYVGGAQAGVKDDLLVRIEGFDESAMSAGDSSLNNAGGNALLLELGG